MGVVVPIFGLAEAMQRRSAAFAPKGARIVVTPGFVFTKDRHKHTLEISYTWGGGSYRNTVDIVPVGVGRYALIHNDKLERIVGSRELLSALADYRRSAAIALCDRREGERATWSA